MQGPKSRQWCGIHVESQRAPLPTSQTSGERCKFPTALGAQRILRIFGIRDRISSDIIFMLTARRYASAVYAVVVCLPVRASVAIRYCTKTTKRGITQGRPYDSPETPRPKISQRNSNSVTANGGAKWRCGRLRSAIFDQ